MHPSSRLVEYLDCRRAPAGTVATAPHPALGIVVVIPCRDEPAVIRTLASLARCRAPRGAVEVLAVLNASERDGDALRRRHRETLARIEGWGRANARDGFGIHALDFPRLPARHAGVGLARRIGMDAAVARFAAAGNPRGVIASLDADCLVDPSYLAALEEHFAAHPGTRACSVYFEHDLEGPEAPWLYRGITDYELFLRYYRHGLAFAGSPFAHYTVGSSMAVRCDAYVRHGGMNRRKAGEDFYFLNKLMAVDGVTELTATRVMPGVRASTRTPFGTGRALGARRDHPGPPLAYDPRVFRDLRALLGRLEAWADLPAGAWRPDPELPETVGAFLAANGMVERHAEMRRHAASPASFRKRFFHWFDALRALKFVHHATRTRYPRRPLEDACATLLRWGGAADAPAAGARALLVHLRDRDRRGAFLTGNGCPLDSQTV